MHTTRLPNQSNRKAGAAAAAASTHTSTHCCCAAGSLSPPSFSPHQATHRSIGAAAVLQLLYPSPRTPSSIDRPVGASQAGQSSAPCSDRIPESRANALLPSTHPALTRASHPPIDSRTPARSVHRHTAPDPHSHTPTHKTASSRGIGGREKRLDDRRLLMPPSAHKGPALALALAPCRRLHSLLLMLATLLLLAPGRGAAAAASASVAGRRWARRGRQVRSVPRVDWIRLVCLLLFLSIVPLTVD